MIQSVKERVLTRTDQQFYGLHQLFERTCDAFPDRIALVQSDRAYTYRELDGRANRKANYLRLLGVRETIRIGLYLDRSSDAIEWILGILKAGGTYVPIDPSFPLDRVKHIVEDAEIQILIHESGVEFPESFGKPLESVSEGLLGLLPVHAELPPDCSPQRVVRPDASWRENLCYLIYTSGSTGVPKAVMTQHRNVLFFVDSFNSVLNLTPEDRIYHGFSLGFDGSVEEMWMAFSNGARLVIPPAGTAKFGPEVAACIKQQGVTVYSTVPTSLRLIETGLESVHTLILSGESCPPELVTRWASPDRRLLNVYGPTETTVNSTVANCLPGEPVTIGRPLPGYPIQILDEQRNPVARGERGELYIGGEGVSLGYLHRPDLTDTHFLELHEGGAGQTSRYYRTGDEVSLTVEGDLLFHGRLDQQIKIRGYRIELTEIESLLGAMDGVGEAVVAPVEQEGEVGLAAYLVPANGTLPEDETILNRLSDALPPYMIPSYLERVPSLPRLASGKVNRKQLPSPSHRLRRTGREVASPETVLEKQLLPVVQEVFKVSDVSTRDDFFLDLGAYSLLAVQLAAEIRNRMGANLAVRDIYSYPSIEKLGQFLERAETTADQTLSLSRPTDRPSQKSVPQLGVTRWQKWGCQLLQGVSGVLLLTLPVAVLMTLYWAFTTPQVSMVQAVTLTGAYLLFGFPVWVLFVIATKWTLVGHFQAGRYPLWGWTYFRFWLVTRLHFLSGIGSLSSTPVLSWYYRMMGAKIGSGTTLATTQLAVFDQISIGSRVSIGPETQLLGYTVSEGMLEIGSVVIEDDCFVGIHCSLGLNTRMGKGSRLDDLSAVPDGAGLEENLDYTGSPAQATSLPGDRL